jgi:hypothetical protein
MNFSDLDTIHQDKHGNSSSSDDCGYFGGIEKWVIQHFESSCIAQRIK